MGISNPSVLTVHGAALHDATVEATANKNVANGYAGLGAGAQIALAQLISHGAAQHDATVEATANKNVANGYAGLDAGVLIPTARLGSGVAGATNYLRGDRSWQPAIATPHTVISTVLDIVNDATEQTFISYDILANQLSTKGIYRVTVFGDYFNNSASNRNLTCRVYFGPAGGTKLYDDVIVTIAVGALRRVLHIDLWLMNQGATNVQWLAFRLGLSDNSATTVGIGSLQVSDYLQNTMQAGIVGAVDTTVDNTLRFTVQHSLAHASLSVRRQFSYGELIV